jgi:hypothetical protein
VLLPVASKLIPNPVAPGGRRQGGDMLRLSHILTTAALVAVCAAPASAVTSEQLHSSDRDDAATKAAADTGFRTSYQPVPPSKTGHGQDLRSPDAVDAAQHRGLYASDRGAYVLNRDYGSPDRADAVRDVPSYVLNRDYGSPDAVDAARNLPPVQIPVVEVRDVPSGGFDWGDAGIGAAGMLALFSIAAGTALMLTGRKRRHGIA